MSNGTDVHNNNKKKNILVPKNDFLWGNKTFHCLKNPSDFRRVYICTDASFYSNPWVPAVCSLWAIPYLKGEKDFLKAEVKDQMLRAMGVNNTIQLSHFLTH